LNKLNFSKNMSLMLSLTKASLITKYRGSYLGGVWAILSPVILVVIYDFVFSARTGIGAFSGGAGFALNAFCGLLVFNFFIEVLLSASTQVQNNAIYVKKIKFPLYILACINVNQSLISFLIGFVILSIYHLSGTGQFSLNYLYIPALILTMYFVAIGLSLLISALGVYVKDLSHFFSATTLILLFATPVFYELRSIDVEFVNIVSYNPISFYIENIRGIMLQEQRPNINVIGGSFVVSFLSCYLGLKIFLKLQPGFADVL
jgi:lipopolysaccharide transport system permease protein